MSPGDAVRAVTHDGFVSALAFTPDGADIVTADDAGVVKVSPVTGQGARFERDLGTYLLGVAVSPDGKVVAVAGRTVLVAYDRVTGDKLWELPPPVGDQLYHLAGFSPDGTFCAAAGTRIAVVADAGTGRVVREIPLDQDVSALTWGDRDRVGRGLPTTRIAVAVTDSPGPGGSVRVLDVLTGAEIARLALGDQTIDDIVWSPVREMVLGLGDRRGQVLALDVRTNRQAWITDLVADAIAMAVDPSGRWAVCACEDSATRVLYASVGVERHRLDHAGAFVNVVAIGRDSAASAPGGMVRVFEPATGARRYEVNFDEGVNVLAFSPDDRYLAVMSGQNVAVLENGP